jgi:hypothetical protein
MRAIAQIIETEDKQMSSIMCEGGCDGSVQAIIYSGKVILLQKLFWNTGTFKKKSMAKFIKSGEQILQTVREQLAKAKAEYPDILA